MATAQDRLNAILPSWYELLTQWSLDGSLVAAATEALVLDGSNAKPDAKGQLQSLTSQWSAGNFKSLPEIVLLSDADISGAQGAYAASTGTIYLNEKWLLTASDEEIQRVLTEELGHSLDAQFNQMDTEGDEGEFFARTLIDKTEFTYYEQQVVIRQEDSGTVIIADSEVPVENASFPLYVAYKSPSSLIQPSSSATLWENAIGTQWSSTIVGSAGDDIYRATNYATGAIHAATNGLQITDLSGNSFVSASSYNWGFGPNGAILNSKFNFGDGYVSIITTGNSGNYVNGLVGSEISMGAGDSDINITIDGSAYYSCSGFSGKIDAGEGSDVLNVYLGYIGDANTAIGSATIDMGGGNDVVSSYTYAYSYNPTWTSRALASSNILMGSGDDIVDLYCSFFYAISDSTIDMGTGNDRVILSGIASNASIGFGDGVDELIIRDTSYDYIVAKQVNDSWKITKTSDLQFSLVVTGLEEIKFDDRTIEIVNEVVDPSGNRSNWTGTQDSDLLIWRGGSEVVDGLDGFDTLKTNSSAANVVVFDYLEDDYIYLPYPNLEGGTLRLKNVESISFVDAQSYSLDSISNDIRIFRDSSEFTWTTNGQGVTYINGPFDSMYGSQGVNPWKYGSGLAVYNADRLVFNDIISELTRPTKNIVDPSDLQDAFGGFPDPTLVLDFRQNYWEGTDQDDVLIFRAGGDGINGKAGFDTLSFGNEFASSSIATNSTGITYINDIAIANVEEVEFIDRVVSIELQKNSSVIFDNSPGRSSWGGTSSDDTLVWLGGTDNIDGGGGYDTLSFRYKKSDVNLDLTGVSPVLSVPPTNGEGGSLFLANVEKLAFTDGDIFLNDLANQYKSFYTFVDGPTWIEARQNALSMGGDLASISDATENSTVYSLLNPAFRSTANAWIGFNRLNSSDWTWSDGSTVTYTNWRVASSEPSGDGQWVQMRHYDGGTWNDFAGPYGYDAGADFYETTKGIAEIPYLSFGSSIYLIVPASTWTEGQAKAVSLGGNLVTINSSEENQWLTQAYGGLYKSYWMGLNDIKNEDDWVWVSGESSTYRNWLPGYPDDQLGTGDEDWGELNFYYVSPEGQTGFWNDNNNDGSGPLYAIVEIKEQLTYNLNLDNNLVIAEAGIGTIDGVAFTNLFSIDLGLDADTVSINESAGTNIPMTLEGGDGTDTLNGNSLKNKLVLTGVNQGTLDGIQFSGFENINLGSGNDEVYILSGGMLTGSLNGGSGGTVTVVPPGGDIGDYDGGGGGGDGYVDGGGNPVTTDPGPTTPDPIEFNKPPEGFKFNGGLNSIFMNDGVNIASINGPGYGVVDGTDFLNFYALDLKGNDDIATISPLGYLFGKLSGGEGNDTLNLSANNNVLAIDQGLVGDVDRTDFESFEIVNLLAGDDSVSVNINALPPSASDPRKALTLNGGDGTDQLTLKMTREEVRYLESQGTFDDLQSYLANPTGTTIAIALSSIDLTLTGFENTGFFNSSPNNIAITSTQFDENIAVGSVVASLSAVDPDQPDGLTFRFVGDNGLATLQSGIFSLDGDKIKVSSVPDYETSSSHDVTVRVSDDYGAYYDKKFTFTVNDVFEPTDTIGVADASGISAPIIVSGSSALPTVETYATSRGKGKNATTTYTWTNISLDNPTRPLDALVVNGGDANNVITAAGFKDDPASTTIETRAAFSGLVVIDGKSGADTITGGTGTNWLIGGGVSTSGTFDSLTGTSFVKDIFDLRRETTAGAFQDAYSLGHAVVNNFGAEDFIVMSGQFGDYIFNPKTTNILNKRGKVVGQSTIFEILNKSNNDLIATVAGSGFTSSTDLSSYMVFGQTSQDPFEVVLPGTGGGTII